MAGGIVVMEAVDEFWEGKAQLNDKGAWKPNSHNALLLLQNHENTAGRVRFNAFTQQIEVQGDLTKRPREERGAAWRQIEETDNIDVRAMFDFKCAFPRETLWEAFLSVAKRNQVHPVREYLLGLQWDGVERLGGLFTRYFVADDTPIHREIGLRFGVGSVARIMKPGCKLDTMPVLEGPLGLFKSSAVAELVPERKWFADTQFDINSKDAYQTLQGIWIYEIAELQQFTRADAQRLKGFISSAVDRFRPPFARLVQSFERQTVFFGTTNESDYIMDGTGDRRRWPIKVKSVDRDGLTRDRDQLWAEARVRYEAGVRWWLEGEAAKEMINIAMERYIEDPWEEELGPKLREHLMKSAACPPYIMSADLKLMVSTAPERMTQADMRRLGKCMRRLGFGSMKRKVTGLTVNTWTVPDALVQEINELKLKPRVPLVPSA